MTDETEIKANRPPTPAERQILFMDWCFRTGWNLILESLGAVLFRMAAKSDFTLVFVSATLPDIKITIEHKHSLIKV